MCKVNRSELVFEPTGSRIVSLPMDASGAAGANFATVSFTELWGFTYEENQRLYDELTPIPGDCLRIVDSYAGFEGESELLKSVWDRGLAGQRIDDDWPIYITGRQLSYIHQGEDAQERCWRFSDSEREPYYEEQRETLRQNAYRRLHLNQWVSSESVFILPEQWDTLIAEMERCPSKDVELFGGLDLGPKHDHTSFVAVYWGDDGLLHLGPYRIWQPVGVIDFGAVAEDILSTHRTYHLVNAGADPYQFLRSIQTLQAQGVGIDEYPQTVANLTTAGNSLFDTIRQGQLVVYPGAVDLRTHVLACTAKETDRGIRLVKTSTGRKIDAAIALAIAVALAVERGIPQPAAGETVNIAMEAYRAASETRQGVLFDRRDQSLWRRRR